MGLFETPSDIRKRQGPGLGFMEAFEWVFEADGPEELAVRKRIISRVSRELSQAKTEYRRKVTAIIDGIDLT